MTGRLLIATLATGLVFSLPARAGRQDGSEPRNLDARPSRIAVPAAAGASQQDEIDRLRSSLPELAFSINPATGATRTLVNRVGYLTEPDGRSPRSIADSYISEHLALLGLEDSDVADRELTDVVHSKVTGATHIYYRQRIHGLPVYNAQLHVNINRDGRILSVNNGFLPQLAAAHNVVSPGIDAAAAVSRVVDHIGVAGVPVGIERVPGARPASETWLGAPELSTEPIIARLMLLPIQRGEARLIWNLQIHTIDGGHAYDFTVDAHSGEIWTRVDWIAGDRYMVYPMPIESPNHALVLPPDDGRTIVTDPHDPVASPFGWHDTNGRAGAESSALRGNNVHAYDDTSGHDTPPANEPDCGPLLECTFGIYLSHEWATYRPASLTNLFYWNNLVHDVQYAYGFDEAAGNFQLNNYGRGGVGSDAVRAEALNGDFSVILQPSRFMTPPDGQAPRMEMPTYFWRDQALDNGIVIHEYGHGIANRLVGGPSNVSCLGNAQQPGEGLSDWWALVYTASPADVGPQPRGIGTYWLGQPRTGGGLRQRPYSTDPAVNDWTYESINGSNSYQIGAVWAQVMWRVYWALVDHHGFDPDLHRAFGGAGNQRAMLYVNEGLKNAPCMPAFTDLRDAILQAAVDNYEGSDVCRVWRAFAASGLGIDAVSGGPDSLIVTNGFDVPASCVDAPPDSTRLVAPLGHIGVFSPAFVWKAVSSATWYQVTVVDGAGQSLAAWYSAAEAGCAAAPTCWITFDAPLHAGAGGWRVRTANNFGSGPWSPVGEFWVGAPPAPALIAPLGPSPTATPTFTWSSVPTATWYQLWVNDSIGTRHQQWYRASEVGCAASAATCHAAPPVVLSQGTALFWVRAWNDVGYGRWSGSGNFTIGLPEVPALIAPRGAITSRTPSYVWYAVAGATWYRIWVTDSSGVRLQRWYTAAESACQGGYGVCQIQPDLDLNPGPAQFWIQAWNPFGSTTWSAAASFTVITVASVTVVETWPVIDGQPGTLVRLWARVKNDSNGHPPEGYLLWFAIRAPDNAVTWTGAQSLTALAPGESRWYFVDWVSAPDAATYEYHAQVWEGSNERSTPAPSRQFTLGFASRFYKTTDGWRATSGFVELPAQGFSRELFLYGLSPTGIEVNASYGTPVNSFGTLDFIVRMSAGSCLTCATRVLIRGTVDPQDPTFLWHSWYAFQYAANGTYSVYKRVAGVTTPLQEWTATGAINTGSAWNAVRIVAHGSSLWFYINDVLVWAGRDADLATGQVGVGAYSAASHFGVKITQPVMREPGAPPASSVDDRVGSAERVLDTGSRRAGAAGDVNSAPERH